MARNGEYMALYNLNRIQNNASNMQQLMQVNNTLPEWAKSKLTQSRSHLSDVANYKRSKPLGSAFSSMYNTLDSLANKRRAEQLERIAQEERLAMQAAQQQERIAQEEERRQAIITESSKIVAGREAAINDAERTRKWILTGIVLTTVLYIANKRYQ